MVDGGSLDQKIYKTKVRKKNLMGDRLMIAASIVYLGPLDAE